MEIPEVLMLILSVIRRLPRKDKGNDRILPESPEQNFREKLGEKLPETEGRGYDTEKGRQALGEGWRGLISSHAFLHPSKIMLGLDNLPYFNTYVRNKNAEKYDSLCPPERSPSDKEPLTEASVVYSIGVLMYSLLVGSVPEPLSAVGPQDLGVSLDNIAGLEPHFSRNDGPGRVVVEMIKLIRQCLKTDPAERPTLRIMEDTVRWLVELSRTINSGDLNEVPDNPLSAWSSRYNKNTFLQIGATRAEKAKKRSSSC
jgi:serine/threonine protein kinase